MIIFKMERLQSTINAMRKTGLVDLAEAFYSIPIQESDRKYFRFWHRDQKFQFTALIMGLTHSPRVFTKTLELVFAHLRAKGHISSAYIDDSCLQGSIYVRCRQNIHDTIQLMDSLGLTVHLGKSVKFYNLHSKLYFGVFCYVQLPCGSDCHLKGLRQSLNYVNEF